MARIKYVLNERRLAIIAAGAATLPAPQGVTVPTTLPGRNDPLAAVEALAGVAPAPDVVRLTEGNRTSLSGHQRPQYAPKNGKAPKDQTPLFEEDEGDRAAYDEVVREEEASKQAEQAKKE